MSESGLTSEFDPASELPTLWHFRLSHYNEKARWALDYKGWPHRRRALVPGFHIPRVRLMTGQNKTPVLQLSGRSMHDSTAIIAELERLQPEPSLYPDDPDQRRRALDIEEHFDEAVAPDLRALFWSCYIDRAADAARLNTAGFGRSTYASFRASWPALKPAFRLNLGLSRERIAEAEANLRGHFDHLESLIGPGGYLVGSRFTVADMTAAAVMTALLRPPEFSYALPDPWPPRLVELRASVADHTAAVWVQVIYARHRGESAEVVDSDEAD